MDTFLARQPIFDSKQVVWAYEILYRSGSINTFDGIDGDQASISVMFNTFQIFGIENVTNGKPVFINFTENLINAEMATLFPKELLVVEILENVAPKEEVIENCKNLKELGYRIALDDFVYSEEYDGLIDLADIIKIDFLESSKEEIENISKILKGRDIILLAEKVETREEFEYAKKLGFTLFQGYFFSKPEIMKSKKLQSIKSTALQLVTEVNEKEIDFKKLDTIIARDLSITYNLLKIVNSSAFGFRYRIESIKHALVALGEKEIKRWIYLVILSDMGQDKPDELTRLSLIRARFAEIVAIKTRFNKQSEEMFLLGLFSLLDVILNIPIEEVLENIKASDIIRQSLINGTGEVGTIYKMIIAYEKGNWEEVIQFTEELKIDYKIVTASYMEALIWYRKIVEI